MNSSTSLKSLTIEDRSFKKSYFKMLIDLVKVPEDSALIKSYLSSPDFLLKPLGRPRKKLSKPHALITRCLYIGEIIDKVPDGLGYLLDLSKNYYEGYFSYGKFSGKGRFFLFTGEIIEGNWAEGQISFGKIYNWNGKTYEGDLSDLQPHGTGKEKSEEFEYEGQYLKSLKHGKGKINWKDGKWYEGEFVNDQIEGVGLFHSDDCDYQGQWKSNNMHGKGTLTWSDNSQYEGELCFGLRHGFGVFISNNKKYSGFWKKGKENGKGRLEENGKILHGIWKKGNLIREIQPDPNEIITAGQIEPEKNHDAEGKNVMKFSEIQFPDDIAEKFREVLEIRNKIGEMRWENGEEMENWLDTWIRYAKGVYFGEINKDKEPAGKGVWLNKTQIYEGNWLNGYRNGHGRLINTFSEIYIGNWLDNVKFGFGVLRKKDAKYIGDWEDNKFHGNGVLISDDFVFDGQWKNGLQHGIGTLQYSDGKVYEGEFANGVISGTGSLTFPNGTGFLATWKYGEIKKKIKKITNEENEDDEDKNEEFLSAKRILNDLIFN